MKHMDWMILGAVVVPLMTVFLFSLAFHRLRDSRETIRFAGEALTIATGLSLAFAGVMTLRDSSQQRHELVLQSRRQAAFSYVGDWQALPFDTLRQLNEHARGRREADVQRLLVHKREYALAAERSIRFFETVGIAIRNGYADETILCALYKDESIEQNLEGAKDWFDWYRRKFRKIPGTFANYDWLLSRWHGLCPTERA